MPLPAGRDYSSVEEVFQAADDLEAATRMLRHRAEMMPGCLLPRQGLVQPSRTKPVENITETLNIYEAYARARTVPTLPDSAGCRLKFPGPTTTALPIPSLTIARRRSSKVYAIVVTSQIDGVLAR